MGGLPCIANHSVRYAYTHTQSRVHSVWLRCVVVVVQVVVVVVVVGVLESGPANIVR